MEKQLTLLEWEIETKNLDPLELSWEELTDTGRWFLKGVHPESPEEPKPDPYLKLLRRWKDEQRDRFSPASKLGEKK